jgi:hypothetical protein
MKPARGIGQVFSREREAHEIGRAAREVCERARGEQAPERCPAGFQRALLDGPARGKRGDRRAHRKRFRLHRLQGAVGVGNRHFGCAQRLACLAPVGFLVLELRAQRLDARAQRGKILLARRPECRRMSRAGSQGKAQEESRRQGFALPCADTAATRLATSAASPR